MALIESIINQIEKKKVKEGVYSYQNMHFS